MFNGHSTFNIHHSTFPLPPSAGDNEVRQVSLQLRGCVRHHNRVLVAHRLAQPASDALVLLHEGDLVVIGYRLVLRLDHVDALERADVDAELASRAELLDHFSLRNVLRLYARDELAMLVLDGVDRAVDAADGAVDTPLGMNVVLAARLAPDRVRGAFDLADTAANAFIGDEVRHGVSVYLNNQSSTVHVKRCDAASSPDQSELRRVALANPDERAGREFASRGGRGAPAGVQSLFGGKGDRRMHHDRLEVEVTACDHWFADVAKMQRCVAIVIDRPLEMIENPDCTNRQPDGDEKSDQNVGTGFSPSRRAEARLHIGKPQDERSGDDRLEPQRKVHA